MGKHQPITNLPKQYLSYSQIKLYLRSPRQYFLEYFIGFREDLHQNVGLGGVFHDTISGLITLEQGKEELMNQGWLPDKCRTLERAYNDWKHIKNNNVEVNYIWQKAKGLGIPLLAFLDAEEEDIIEYKTGMWDIFQLQFYHWLVWKVTGKLKKVKLVEISTTSGKSKVRVFKFTARDRRIVEQKIMFAYTGITNGVWKRA